MRSSKSHLIVPIRDRRQRKRYLTKRNLGLTTLVLIALFAIITIRSEMFRPESGFGRLYERELPAAPVAAPPMEVVRETPSIAEQEGADPLLMEPAVRAQKYLDTVSPVTPAQIVDVPQPDPPVAPGGRVVIVGGAEGVAVVKEKPTERRLLTGGFGRQ
ncbi:MAG TPA: hypothetical protein VF618_18165 [Thermoanaerobaculia bacterium]